MSTASPVRTLAPGEKLAAVIAHEIEDEILARNFPVGEVVGSEPELIERYEVSRAVLREAVRLLEHRQVATMRRGPGGGLVVQAPPAAAIVEVLSTYFDFVAVSPHELFEARQALEQVAAGLAAQHISDVGVQQLREILQAEDEGRLDIAADYHTLVAEESDNAALAVFIKALTTATAYRFDPRGLTAAHLDESRHHHHKILEAIAAGDAARAEREMADHMAATRWLEDATLQDRRTNNRSPRARRDWAKSKLPEKLAYKIRGEIIDKGWPVGEVIGSEADFLERLAVSRAAFREAVRILEYYGVARMRRGPGGGLVVGEPDVARIVDVTSLYLEYMRTDRARLHRARVAIEVAAAALAAERLDDDGEAELRAALEAERGMTVADVNDVSHGLHLVIARLSGNRPLELFTHVLTRLTAAHVPGPRRLRAQERAEVAGEVARSHAQLAEAILARDPALARRRMARHLDAIAPFLDRIESPVTRRGGRAARASARA